MDLFALDRPLLEILTPQGSAKWTIRHAVEGVQIFGGIGSGKTSGSGRLLALKYLSGNFGGLVLTVKPGEKEDWVEYCRMTSRLGDLIVLEPGGKHSFNFLEYESSNSGGNEALTENIVDVLKTVIKAGEEKSGGKSDDPFWESSLDMLIFNVIDLCKLAYNYVTLQDVYDIVQTLPKPKETIRPEDRPSAYRKAFELALKNVNAKVDVWEASLSPEDKFCLSDNRNFETEIIEAVPAARLFKFLDQFFNDSFKNLGEKTRSIIELTFSGFLFRLLREPVYSLFCRNHSTVTPEDSLKGKIILIDLPVKIYHKVGRDCQILFKYIWQRAMEKRRVTDNMRPLFLWADEAQNFLHEHDADYHATARSSRIATVYISQNLPNYYASMGGQKAEYRVKSFIGTLGTKIFHANADLETNKYASELIGEDYFTETQEGKSIGSAFSRSTSGTLKLSKMVRPEEFMSLKTGGPNNKYNVQGYVHRQGDALFNGFNFEKVDFYQKYESK